MISLPEKVNTTEYQFISSRPRVFSIHRHPIGISMGLVLQECKYHNLPHIQAPTHRPRFPRAISQEISDNKWILAGRNKHLITEEKVKKIIRTLQYLTKKTITFDIAKRKSDSTPAMVQQNWSIFNQIIILLQHIVDIDSIFLSQFFKTAHRK